LPHNYKYGISGHTESNGLHDINSDDLRITAKDDCFSRWLRPPGPIDASWRHIYPSFYWDLLSKAMSDRNCDNWK